MLDPEQTARLYPGQSADQIAALNLTGAQRALRDSLSYRYSIAPPQRDSLGNITSLYLGLADSVTSPDPDLIVTNGVQISNGPRSPQTTTLSYVNGNPTSIDMPMIAPRVTIFNDAFDIPTSTTDENGSRRLQTVDPFGLVTSVQLIAAAPPWQNPANRLDVNNSGNVSSLDALIISNYLGSNGNGTGSVTIPHPAPAPTFFYDVNGDGLVTALDALQVINSLGVPGGPADQPVAPVVLQHVQFTHSSPTGGLPRGLVTQQRVVTGRASGDIVTDYEYVTTANTPGATPMQIGQVRRMTVAAGVTGETSVTNYTYDARGNLTAVTDPLGRITRMYYDSLDRMIGQLSPDPDGAGPLLPSAARFQYDAFGNQTGLEVINSFMEGGKTYVTSTKTSTVFDARNRPVIRYEQNPVVTWYWYGAGATILHTNSKATAATLPTPTIAQLERIVLLGIPMVNMPSAAANQGLTTFYVYDVDGDLVTMTETLAGATTSARQTDFTRDALGRITRKLDPEIGGGLSTHPGDKRIGGRVYTDYTYDNVGNVTKTIGARSQVTTQTYDDLNRITSQTLPHDTLLGAAGATTTFAYTPTLRGWDESSTNSLGQTVTRSVNSIGQVTSVSGDTPAQSWTYWTDGVVMQSTDADGNATTYDYTRRGQIKSVTQPIADAMATVAAVTTYNYAADGRATSVVDPLGRTMVYAYRPDGLVSTITQPDPDGAGPLTAARTNFVYDAMGNLRSQSDSITGSTSTFDYDSHFRTTTATDPLGATTTTAYTMFGEVASITDPLGNATLYTYNGRGNLLTERKVHGTTNRDRTFSYDSDDNLRQINDRNGRTTNRWYDYLNRVLMETWATGQVENRRFNHTYDAIGNTTAIADSDPLAPDFTFTYDARNQLQLERQAVPGLTPVILDRDYDSRGNRVATSVTLGGSIVAGTGGGSVSGGVKDLVNTYSFDTLGRTTAITQTSVTGGNVVAAKRADYGYNLAGQVTDLRRYSAATPSSGSLEVHSRSGYDSAGRLTSLIHNRTEITSSSPYIGGSSLPTSVTPATAIAAYAFTFDAGNRMTAMSSYADRFRTTYGYDNSDQLTAASSVAIAGLAAPTFLPVAEGYQLDANGNRRSSTGTSQSAAGTHNQLQTDGTFNYTYDNEGNTTRKTAIVGGAYTEYVWNHRNQLTAVIDRTSAGAQVKRSDYSYDAFDRRTLDRYDAPGATGYDRYDWFITDGQHEVMVMRDADGAGTTQTYRIANRFLHGASVDEVLSDEQYANGSGPLLASTTAFTTAGTTLWTIADHLGSIRDVVDNNGIVRQHVVYDSFGRRVNEVDRNAAGAVIASTSTEAIDELFGYTGRDFDAETGLQYNRARWFDPGTGRWMSRDPIGFEAGDANLYRYVGNASTTFTDPSGLKDLWWWWYHNQGGRQLNINNYPALQEKIRNSAAAQTAMDAMMEEALERALNFAASQGPNSHGTKSISEFDETAWFAGNMLRKAIGAAVEGIGGSIHGGNEPIIADTSLYALGNSNIKGKGLFSWSNGPVQTRYKLGSYSKDLRTDCGMLQWSRGFIVTVTVTLNFRLDDSFTDPFDVFNSGLGKGIETGRPYAIAGSLGSKTATRSRWIEIDSGTQMTWERTDCKR